MFLIELPEKDIKTLVNGLRDFLSFTPDEFRAAPQSWKTPKSPQKRFVPKMYNSMLGETVVGIRDRLQDDIESGLLSTVERPRLLRPRGGDL